jgi:hypothetical protein
MKVRIPDNKKYEKALEILYQMGGFFWSWPDHVLGVGPTRFRALAAAGLVGANGKERSRPKKKNKTVQS